MGNGYQLAFIDVENIKTVWRKWSLEQVFDEIKVLFFFE